jgi:hypothetical protein
VATVYIVTTVAGIFGVSTNLDGPYGTGTFGDGAVYGLAIDSYGNLIMSQYGTEPRIRILAKTDGTYYGVTVSGGSLGTIAGKGGTQGFADGNLNTGRLNNPSTIAVDLDGNIIIADTNNNRIRILAKTDGTYYGVNVSGGSLGTIAGTGSLGSSNGRSLSGTFTYPTGVCVDSYGNIIIGDSESNKIRILAKTDGTYYGVTVSGGSLGTIAGTGTAGSLDGTSLSGTFTRPNSVRIDSYGNIIITDTENNKIRILAKTSGTFYGVYVNANSLGTIAGDGTSAFANGSLGSGKLNRPLDTAIDILGNIIVSDRFNRRIRIIAKTSGTYYGVYVQANSLETIAGTEVVGGADGPSLSATFSNLLGVAIDDKGDIFIASANTVRKLTSS